MNHETLAADREHILAHTSDLWTPLRGARVFITGGTGFVGTWLLEAFVAANRAHALNARAVVLSRDPRRFEAKAPHVAHDAAIEFAAGDSTSFEFPQGDFTHVIHAATERSFEADAARPLGIVEPDLISTRRVCEFAAQARARRLLFTSSGAVYGAAAASLERVSEAFSGAPDPTAANAAYGESKRLSEFACSSYGRAFGFDVTIARLFAFVGPHLPLDEGYAVGNFVRDVLEGKPIAIGGDGTARRSYLYAADLAIWLWTILLRGERGRAYNVGSPDAVSIKELADTVAQTLAPGTPVTVGKTPIAGAAPHSYVPDVARAEAELNLRAHISLPEALHRTHAFYTNRRRTPTTR